MNERAAWVCERCGAVVRHIWYERDGLRLCRDCEERARNNDAVSAENHNGYGRIDK